MSNVLRLTLVIVFTGFLAGCATQPAVRPRTTDRTDLQRMSKVRTTAYTQTERGGRRNAIGKRLSGRNVISAASDWSRFPLGTKFRLVSTKEVFQIDDYGTALVGTNTIDLYKTNRLAMRTWGVRHVDIDILKWGSDQQSLQVLAPRKRHRTPRRMILALQQKARTESTLRTF